MVNADIEAAIVNERITRNRVEAIEQWLNVWASMSLWSRLMWLFKGVQ